MTKWQISINEYKRKRQHPQSDHTQTRVKQREIDALPLATDRSSHPSVYLSSRSLSAPSNFYFFLQVIVTVEQFADCWCPLAVRHFSRVAAAHTSKSFISTSVTVQIISLLACSSYCTYCTVEAQTHLWNIFIHYSHCCSSEALVHPLLIMEDMV